MDEKMNTAVQKATCDTMSGMLGLEVSSGPARSGPADISQCDLSVVIGFSGQISGAFLLRGSKKLAVDIASRMLGMEVEEDSDDSKDAIGEILNMIVGSVKTYYSDDPEIFRMSIPTTVSGSDYVLHIKGKSECQVSSIDFKYNHSFSIEIYLKYKL